jgi:hypothetical protein
MIPVRGAVDVFVAMALFAFGTGAFAGLMTGRYPLLKLTEFMLAARWRERVAFLPLLEDAADRGVLRRDGAGYQFADDETRTRLAALGRAALGDHAPRRDRRAGVGARLAGASDSTVTRVTADIAIGGALAFLICAPFTGVSAHDPVWLIVLLSVLFCAIIIGFCLRYVKGILSGIVGTARWRLGRAVVELLPAALIAGCGTWAWLLVYPRVWTGLYVLLAGLALAFARWPGRLAQTIRWFGRLRVVPAVDTTRRTLTVVHIGLLVIVFVGLTAPAALASTFQRQMRSAYIVALQRSLEADGELAVFAEVRAQFASAAAQPVLADIVLSIHDVDSPRAGEDDAGATPTETDLARRVGELQALALGAALPRTLLAAEQVTARDAGFDGPMRDASDAGERLAAIQHEQAADDSAARRADQAGDLAASALASTISIPRVSDNEVFQIVREYLSGLIEGSPLKDTFAAWIGHLSGANAPPAADQAVIPDPQRLRQAALTVLSGEMVIADAAVTDPAVARAETESPVDAAVDLANQSRYIQEGTGPCAGCVRSPANPADNPGEPPADHEVEP